jgi:hypothetical protein
MDVDNESSDMYLDLSASVAASVSAPALAPLKFQSMEDLQDAVHEHQRSRKLPPVLEEEEFSESDIDGSKVHDHDEDRSMSLLVDEDEENDDLYPEVILHANQSMFIKSFL